MKKLIVAVFFCLKSTNSFAACSTTLIDNLAASIDGTMPYSVNSMKTAVLAVKACAQDKLNYAAEQFASKIEGDHVNSEKLSKELANLCESNPDCAKTLVHAIGSQIQGDWVFSIEMSEAIEKVVQKNRYYSTQCAAVEAIAGAIDPRAAEAEEMNQTIKRILNIEVNPDK